MHSISVVKPQRDDDDSSPRTKQSRPRTPTKQDMTTSQHSKRQQIGGGPFPDLTPASDDESHTTRGEGETSGSMYNRRNDSIGGLSSPSLVEECDGVLERNFSNSFGDPACSPAQPHHPRVVSPLAATDPIEIDGAAPPPPQPDFGGRGAGVDRAEQGHVRSRSTGDLVENDDDIRDDAGGGGTAEPPPCFFGVPSSSSLLGLRRSHSCTAATEFEDGERLAAAFDGRLCQSESGAESRSPSPPLREIWQGDIGLALFSPLDLEACEPLQQQAAAAEQARHDERHHPATEAEEENEEEELPLVVHPEPPNSLKSSPRILTESLMRQIRDRGLHPTVQLMSWHRAYSLSRDGDSFHTMLMMCEGYTHTVFAARTSTGDILGGYADKPWSRQVVNGKKFYGSGRSFLFATDPALDEDLSRGFSAFDNEGGDSSSSSPRPPGDDGASGGRKSSAAGGVAFEADGEERLHVYKWTGDNTYSQIFDAEGEHMAMGGGGMFGIIVEENFTRGSTGRCATFGNPPLTRDLGGCFDIHDFEVYGLRSSLTGSFSMMF